MKVAIQFGPMSMVLALGAAQGLVVALLLMGTRANRVANRLLACFVLVTVLRIIPFAIGYAGFYDAYPWLSFAPYNLSFAFGPFLFLFVVSLALNRLPSRWVLHFAPASVQFAYYLIIFPQSISFKNHWNRQVQDPWIVPLEQTATLISIGIYLWAAIKQYREYRRQLGDEVRFDFEFRLAWIRNFLFVAFAWMLVWASFLCFDRFVRPLSYFSEFPLYLVFALFVEYLGFEGWRHAGDRIPHPQVNPAVEPERLPAVSPFSTKPESPVAKNWTELGKAWLHEIEDRELWRNPDLTAALLARELGTNTTYLSRGLNEGLGQTFSECINRLRIAEVQRRLQASDAGQDLLAVAFESGFRSKASFNRAFKLYTSDTPSGYRTGAAFLRLKS